MKKTITVIGLGGVGGYFGFKLAQAYSDSPRVKVTFVARNETYAVVKQNGLTLLSAEHPIRNAYPQNLTNNLKDLPALELVLICVKEYDLEAVCDAIKDKIKEDTIILPLMNGADIYERIRSSIQNGCVLPACVYVASHLKEKGVIEHNGKPGKIIFGNDPLKSLISPDEIVSLLKNAGIDAEYAENSLVAIWTKFCFIASFGQVTARYNKSIGQVNEEVNLKAEAEAIINEISQIAHRKGVKISETIISETFEKAASFPYNTPTSLQLDIQSQKAENELGLFAGTIIKYGKELGVAVPAATNIYNEIKTLGAVGKI